MKIENCLLYLLLIICSLVLIVYNCTYKDTFVDYKIGYNSYKVHENMENYEQAANRLDHLNKLAKKLIYHLNDKYLNDINGYNTIKEKYKKIVVTGINSLTNSYNTDKLQENIPTKSDPDTSYILDKTVFAMCLRDEEHGFTDDYNDILFVWIHEMSHLFTKAYGHDREFWNNFRFILNEAVLLDLYKPVDYKKSKVPYCGIKISYSPLYDNELDNYLL